MHSAWRGAPSLVYCVAKSVGRVGVPVWLLVYLLLFEGELRGTSAISSSSLSRKTTVSACGGWLRIGPREWLLDVPGGLGHQFGQFSRDRSRGVGSHVDMGPRRASGR